jgi:hypothetical protein
MTAAASTDWLWYAAGVVLGTAGLALLAWALFWDRARGRKRCPKCWYDMQGAEADERGAFTCPECGRTIKRERKLRRTRRRWRWAMLAAPVLLTGLMTGLWPQFQNGQWARLAPDWILVRYAPFEPKSTSGKALLEQLQRDVRAPSSFSDHQFHILIERAHREKAALLTPEMHFRDTWPRTLPILIDWRNLRAADFDVRARFRQVGYAWHYAPRSLLHTLRWDAPFHGDLYELEWDVLRMGKVVWTSGRRTIRMVDSAEEIMQPLDGAEIEEAIGIGVVVLQYDRLDDPVRVLVGSPMSFRLANTQQLARLESLGLIAELRHKELVVARMSGRSASWLEPMPRQVRFVDLEWDFDALREACEDMKPHWRIVVRGDAERALWLYDSDYYFAGEVEVEFDWLPIERWCLDNVFR